MEKLALCVGKNNYATSPLSGCVNDANDIADRLEADKWKVIRLLNSDATVDNCERVLTDYAMFSKEMDGLMKSFWSNSSHGTDWMDVDGDESEYDEAIYLDRVWIDDNICKVLQKFHPATDLGVLFDSCFSKTATRSEVIESTVSDAKPRYISIMPIPITAVRRRRIARLPLSEMFWYHYAGCGDREYSYDAWFNGRPNGAMTYYFLKSLADGREHKQVQDLIRQKLPSTMYPQTPDLEGSHEDKFLLGDTIIPTPTKLTCCERFKQWFKNNF
jgi:hypothetical protein